VFDYEVVRYVDGFFEPSSLVVSARFGYICCVDKAFHVAKLRDGLFTPQAFNAIWFYSHDFNVWLVQSLGMLPWTK